MAYFRADGLIGCCAGLAISRFDEIDYFDNWGYKLRKPKHIKKYYNDDDDFKTTMHSIFTNHSDYGFAIATTNNVQKNTNRLLKEMGFHRTKSYANPNHPGSRVWLWWIGVEEFFEKNGE